MFYGGGGSGFGHGAVCVWMRLIWMCVPKVFVTLEL